MTTAAVLAQAAGEVSTGEAVAFWNDTLSDLELGVRLREAELIICIGTLKAHSYIA